MNLYRALENFAKSALFADNKLGFPWEENRVSSTYSKSLFNLLQKLCMLPHFLRIHRHTHSSIKFCEKYLLNMFCSILHCSKAPNHPFLPPKRRPMHNESNENIAPTAAHPYESWPEHWHANGPVLSKSAMCMFRAAGTKVAGKWLARVQIKPNGKLPNAKSPVVN